MCPQDAAAAVRGKADFFIMTRLSILFVLCVAIAAADGGTIQSCAHILPQSPTVELQTNLTAFCLLNQTCLEEQGYPVSSGELFWKIGNTVIPERQYSVVNGSASSVTFQPTLSMHNSVTCSFKAYGQTEVTLHGIYLTLGRRPEKPENLTCVCYNAKTLTCTWEPGRATLLPTTYTLRQYWVSETRKECVAQDGNNFCTLNFPDFMLYINTVFRVEAENELGKAISDSVGFDVADILKPNPPDIVSVSAVLENVLRVEWQNPTNNVDLKYNLRYKPQGSSEWSEVPSDDLEKTRSSFILQGLQTYTAYVVSVRCKPITGGFWSEWSKEHTATTSESAPSRGPELWRKITKTNEERIVQLMWKDLKSAANGIILGYNLTVRRNPEEVKLLDVEVTTYDLTVPKDSEKCEVVLTAYNSKGSSPPSTLIIPALMDKKVVPPAAVNLRAYAEDGRLMVEWTPVRGVLGYVIEWCSNVESMDCDAKWQREPSDTTKTFLRGDIKPFVYYLIRLNPLYRDGREGASYVGTYLQQGAPAIGPVVQTKSSGKTWVTLEWKPVPLDRQNGFITNYIIKYEGNDGSANEITVNASVLEYELKSLSAKTAYSVSVIAQTEKGKKPGLPLSFTTLPFDHGEVEAIVVSSCLGFLVFILVLCFLFCNKKEEIKKHIWPNVPDPSKSNIAQWSPQTPTRHESKRHPFQDGPFTNVSVVEITVGDEKKNPYSEQDLNSDSVDSIKKNTSDGLSSGIGSSSCLSSPRLSVSDSDGVSCAQNTSSTVQYSTVIMGGYQGQTPMFSRSESTQPLLVSEERPDEQQQSSEDDAETQAPSQYFKQNFSTEDGAQVLEPPPAAHTQEPAAQVLHLAGFSQGHDNLDFTAENSNPENRSQGDELKTYLPQNARQGGYLPQ